MTTDNIDKTTEYRISDQHGTRILDMHAGRRAFVRSLGLGLGGAALLGAAPGLMTTAHAQVVSDVDILNFALNLEYLEAEFYLQAVSGHGLDSADIGESPGGVIGGHRVKFDQKRIMNFATEIAGDEEAHVRFLRSALGSAAVSRPIIDLRKSFTDAARAAGLIGPNQKFDAFADDTSFLLAAFIFEDVGVTAYKGAAPLLANKDYLAAAAGILAVEAYHAGTIRSQLYERELFSEAAKISALRDSVDGPEEKDQGIGGKNQANIVPSNRYGIANDRSPREVLNIVYLGANRTRGGFFPNGLNGTITK